MPTTSDTAHERLLIPGAEVRQSLGGIGVTKYSELCNTGELERVFIGRKTYVVAESLRAYVERLRAAAPLTTTAD